MKWRCCNMPDKKNNKNNNNNKNNKQNQNNNKNEKNNIIGNEKEFIKELNKKKQLKIFIVKQFHFIYFAIWKAKLIMKKFYI